MGELVARKSSLLVSRAAAAWKYLHGTINIYKPAEMETTQVITAIKLNLCRGERNLEWIKHFILSLMNFIIFPNKFRSCSASFSRPEYDGIG